jgi:hypothetical protein
MPFDPETGAEISFDPNTGQQLPVPGSSSNNPVLVPLNQSLMVGQGQPDQVRPQGNLGGAGGSLVPNIIALHPDADPRLRQLYYFVGVFTAFVAAMVGIYTLYIVPTVLLAESGCTEQVIALSSTVPSACIAESGANHGGSRGCEDAIRRAAATASSNAAYASGYMGAALSTIGSFAGGGFGAVASASTMSRQSICSVVFSLPIIFWGMFVAVIIYPQGDQYCPQQGYASFAAGISTGGACFAAGMMVALTRNLKVDEDDANCNGNRLGVCALCGITRSIIMLVANMVAFFGLMTALVYGKPTVTLDANGNCY